MGNAMKFYELLGINNVKRVSAYRGLNRDVTFNSYYHAWIFIFFFREGVYVVFNKYVYIVFSSFFFYFCV